MEEEEVVVTLSSGNDLKEFFWDMDFKPVSRASKKLSRVWQEVQVQVCFP